MIMDRIRLNDYTVSRTGSNAENQHATNRAPLAIIVADNQEQAEKILSSIEGRVTVGDVESNDNESLYFNCWNNQYLSIDETTDSEREMGLPLFDKDDIE